MNPSEIELPSPCTTVCVMDPASGYCRGCFRTLAEIAGWAEFSGPERLTVLQHLRQRRGGRPGRRRG